MCKFLPQPHKNTKPNGQNVTVATMKTAQKKDKKDRIGFSETRNRTAALSMKAAES